MIRIAFAAAALMLLTAPAHAGPKDKAIELCKDSMKEEFGAAEIEFERFRRGEDRDYATGTVQMTDGSTRRIQCRVRKGRVLDVRFRTPNASGQLWTFDRPPEAGFIEPEKDEPKEETAKDESAAAEAEKPEENRPVRKRVGGKLVEEQAADKPADAPAGDDTQAADKPAGDDAAQADKPAGETKAETDASKDTDAAADKDAADKDDAEKEEEYTGPVFKKAPKY